MARSKVFDEDAALDRALRLFWRRGYHGTSIQDLVEHMGINRGSLYNTFGGKQQLYRTALERYQKRHRDSALGLTRNAASPVASLRHLLQMTVEEALHDTELKGCFLVNATTELATADSDVNGIVYRNALDFAHELQSLVAAGQQMEQFRADLDPAQAAAFLIHLINGMWVQARLNPQRDQLESTVELAFRALT